LVAGLKIEDLGRRSIPRNPLLFGLLHRMRLVENTGSGYKRMSLALEEHGLATIRELLQAGEIDYTIPQKPNSRLQKYRLTPKGRANLQRSRSTSA
jgi:predicted HTH transcriptional regulator